MQEPSHIPKNGREAREDTLANFQETSPEGQKPHEPSPSEGSTGTRIFLLGALLLAWWRPLGSGELLTTDLQLGRLSPSLRRNQLTPNRRQDQEWGGGPKHRSCLF